MAAKKKTGAKKAAPKKKATKSKKAVKKTGAKKKPAKKAAKKTGAKKAAAKKTGAKKASAKKTGAKKAAAKKTGAKASAKKTSAKKSAAKKPAKAKKATGGGGKVKKAIYLEFVGGASSKFWEGSVQGNEFHVRYGRIGADGAHQVKTFGSPEEAHEQYVKVMEQKLKKGYGVAKKPAASKKPAAEKKAAAPKAAKKANGAAKKKAPPPPATDASSAYLEFVGGSSSKFWEGSVQGSDLHVRYGRIGSDGATQLKSFGSPDEAREAYDKLVHQKLKKGYSLVT